MRLAELQSRPSGEQHRIGSGGTATIHSTKEEPGTVTKKAHGRAYFRNEEQARRDPNFIFLNFILTQENLRDNRYLPRVYHLDAGTDDNGRGYYEADMERLQQWKSLTDREAEVVLRQIFKDVDSLLNAAAKEFGTNVRSPQWKETLYHIVAETVEGSEKWDRFIKDSHFYRAVKFIRMLLEKRFGNYDIMPDNLAWRRGAHGPQLVFLDPVG